MNPDLVRVLAELSVLYPGMRLGQLVEMLASLADDGEGDERLLLAGKAHLSRRLAALGRTTEGLATEELPAARADLLTLLRVAGAGAEPVLGEWSQRVGTRLYDAEDEELLASARPRVRLGERVMRQAPVGAW